MIDVEAAGDVRVVSIDRDEKRNALDVGHCEALRRSIGGCASAGARAVVVTGKGRAFCAGADFGEVGDERFRGALYGTLREVARVPIPVVAAINGPAIGAGLQLAIACDLRVAAPDARFSLPSARLGLAVDPWTIRRLASLAGAGTAAALMLACADLTAGQALAAGLADQAGDLEAAVAVAARIASCAPLTLAYSKSVIQSLASSRVDEQSISAAFDACWASADFAEGLLARSERRPPRFEGQ
ncbi:MAG: enoyl-CoA hydratase [Acidimicrobiales bacterium]